jgi:hypothetical protein
MRWPVWAIALAAIAIVVVGSAAGAPNQKKQELRVLILGDASSLDAGTATETN